MVNTDGACHASLKNQVNGEKQEEYEHHEEEDKGLMWAPMGHGFSLEVENWVGSCFSFLSLMTEGSGWFIME